jgi:catechol 2,3-dioxygenase-like lactoylglutathione lyase family enzyme
MAVPDVTLTERMRIPENPVGIVGIDHVGVPSRDPDAAGKFVEQILGGVEVYRAGYSEEDIRRGRHRHIFYHVGNQILEVAEQEDASTGYPARATQNNQPHWAFATTAAGLMRFAEHLRSHGIPFDGPRTHRGMTVTSIYFRDVDGNNLEVTTWERLPADHTTEMSKKGAGPQWEQLAHSWRPR